MSSGTRSRRRGVSRLTIAAQVVTATITTSAYIPMLIGAATIGLPILQTHQTATATDFVYNGGTSGTNTTLSYSTVYSSGPVAGSIPGASDTIILSSTISTANALKSASFVFGDGGSGQTISSIGGVSVDSGSLSQLTLFALPSVSGSGIRPSEALSLINGITLSSQTTGAVIFNPGNGYQFLTLSAGGTTFDIKNASASISFSSNSTTISGGKLIKTGAGTLFIGSGTTNNYAALEIDGGVLFTGNTAALLATPATYTQNAIAINGGTFRYSGPNSNSYAPNIGFSIGSSGGSIENATAANIVSIAGTVTGSGLFTKGGAGVLAVNADNAASTAVVAGDLDLTGKSYGGGISVTSSAILSGSGTVASGAVSISSGGTISPGKNTNNANGGGKFTAGGDLGMASGANLLYNFGAPNLAGGSTSNDLLVVGGNLTISANETLTVVPNSQFAKGTYQVISYTNLTQTASDINADLATWKIIGIGGVNTYGVTGDYYFTLDTTDSLITLTFNTVPEPATVSMSLVIGGLGLLSRRRRAKSLRATRV